MASDKINYSVLDIKERERKRIAKDLHDISLQNLSYLIHKIELTSLYIDKDPVRAKLELATIEKGMRQVIDEMRKIVFNLHPITLEDLGLKPAMERMIDMINSESRFFIEKEIEDVSCENKMLLMSLLRIASECCCNAVKHSNGNKIFVSFKFHNDRFLLKVTDNGCGFNESEVICKDNHFGLQFMKERVYLLNGKMNIDSSEQGTCIEIEIPYQDNY